MDDWRRAVSGLRLFAWVMAARAGFSIIGSLARWFVVGAGRGGPGLTTIVDYSLMLGSIAMAILLSMALLQLADAPPRARARGLFRAAFGGFLASEVGYLCMMVVPELMAFSSGESFERFHRYNVAVGTLVSMTTWAFMLAALYQLGWAAGRAPRTALWWITVAAGTMMHAMHHVSPTVVSTFHLPNWMYTVLQLPLTVGFFGSVIAQAVTLERAVSGRVAAAGFAAAVNRPQLPGI